MLMLAVTAASAAAAPRRITGATPLRMDGIGPIRIGMRLHEVIEATGMTFTDPKKYDATDDPNVCTYVSFRNSPADVSFMLLDGVVARIDVWGRATNRTAEGVGIGTSERELRHIYRAAKIDVAPSHYEGDAGREFTVTMRDHPGLRYFFATDLKKVVGMRIGRKIAVTYVEGCL